MAGDTGVPLCTGVLSTPGTPQPLLPLSQHIWQHGSFCQECWDGLTVEKGNTIQNYALLRGRFKMLTHKQILSQIQPGDWFVTVDLKDAYCMEATSVSVSGCFHRGYLSSQAGDHGCLPYKLGHCLWQPFAYGVWRGKHQSWHINCLKLLAIYMALSWFLPMLQGYHVLVRTDNMTVVAYINHQGGCSLTACAC